MELSEIKMRVMRAIDTLFARDSNLFDQGAAEWAIAHRLAVYLENEFPGWNVDCEYNKQGPNKDPKKMLNQQTSKGAKRVRPDIIVHHRTRLDLEHNLLVIELKKQQTKSDEKKACEYTKPPQGERKFQYQFGLALSINGGPKMCWFANGDVT